MDQAHQEGAAGADVFFNQTTNSTANPRRSPTRTRQIAGSLAHRYPEIAQWLIGLDTKSPMTIGNYTYLDGGLHVQLSIARDAIIDKLCAKRKDTRIAFLCTPTTHPIVKSTRRETQKSRATGWQSLVHFLSSERF